MMQHELVPPQGSRHNRKRVGRGDGSGHGSYSGRGLKGQKARSGGSIPRHFEGGQLPLVKRLPRKRGFVNIFRLRYEIVNVGELNRFDAGTAVDPRTLFAAGLIDSSALPVKILGDGDLSHLLVVKAHGFSKSAKEKIEAVGGKAEEMR